MSTRPDTESMYEHYVLDEALDRLQEWIIDDKCLADVEAALEDYKTQVLTPTRAVLQDWLA